MATYNKKLETLTTEEIENISVRFLMGWYDLSSYGFRLKGLNRKRVEIGLEPLTKEMSDAYRLDYVRAHFSDDVIRSTISTYLETHHVDKARWSGIELFDCRFGREYARLFKALLGAQVYRDVSEKSRVRKLVSTQVDLYGGVGLAGRETFDKAHATVMARYGVSNVMQCDEVVKTLQSPFADAQVRRKACITRLMRKKATMSQSSAEVVVYDALVSRYGVDDVYYEYGIHPYDARYPYSCDFYIKSQDLFIELNAHYSHGNHWYDAGSHDDVLRVRHLLESGNKRSANAVKTWTVNDVAKRAAAKASGIKYLVFWDGTQSHRGNKKIANVSDFKQWFDEYDADYEAFIHDHPENTY